VSCDWRPPNLFSQYIGNYVTIEGENSSDEEDHPVHDEYSAQAHQVLKVGEYLGKLVFKNG
jgi:hypothetical protein